MTKHRVRRLGIDVLVDQRRVLVDNFTLRIPTKKSTERGVSAARVFCPGTRRDTPIRLKYALHVYANILDQRRSTLFMLVHDLLVIKRQIVSSIISRDNAEMKYIPRSRKQAYFANNRGILVGILNRDGTSGDQ